MEKRWLEGTSGGLESNPPTPKAGLMSTSNRNKLYSMQSGKAMKALHCTPSPQVTLVRSFTSHSTFVSLLAE